MSQELSNPRQASREVGAVIPGFGAAGGMTPEDVQLPRVVLLQSQSKVVQEGAAAAGNYHDTLMGDVIGAAFDFIPVITYTNRVYLEMGTGLKCRSADMVTGVGDPGGSCDACALKDWPPAGSKKKGPECNVSRNWLGLIVGAPHAAPGKKGDVIAVEPLAEPRIAILQWRSMATTAAKKLNGIHLNASLMSPTAREWHDRVYRIGVSFTRNDLGAFYVPTVSLVGKTTDEQKAQARFIRETLLGRDLATEVPDVDEDEFAQPEREF